jgi:hypothetical protein
MLFQLYLNQHDGPQRLLYRSLLPLFPRPHTAPRNVCLLAPRTAAQQIPISPLKHVGSHFYSYADVNAAL